ncbi:MULTISPECIES: LamG-like jellyroll fold domain-containing protein [unclassified Brenneria]|uniref:LamG-like jellyroll fold domain-containing protein n=1 Tax=unclassified Brenneria TaxID=2634434 RepID=UPI0018F09175|nr:LamG-like jellyroll fold domain-containing protein [Brenneria sp. L3-3C-1]MBJ7222836.1 alginate lyase family protein [Brenneria sp. L3-3C-1]MEE3644079.1 LamG-like jellyroll fold domain-containing protein [Brenneria sp. L3_3C_1]
MVSKDYLPPISDQDVSRSEETVNMPRRRQLLKGGISAALMGTLYGRLISTGSLALAVAGTEVAAAERNFVHPGLLHTEDDFALIRKKIAVSAQPWLDGWNALLSDGYSQPDRAPRPVETVVRGGTGNNYAQLHGDIQRAYQLAVRWKISQDARYGDQAVAYLNAWSSTLKTLTGNADRYLAAGIYGYQFANVGEIMRTYQGWSSSDLARFQEMMLTVFYPLSSRFLREHNDAEITNYWANWDQCAIACILATGVLCDRPDIYAEAVNYYKYGQGNGAALQAVYHVHPGYLGQWQESGRDQGHCTLGISLAAAFCEMAWNQGDDMYGYDNNRFLAGAEYVAKSNLKAGSGEFYTLPWLDYRNRHGLAVGISPAGQGNARPTWECVYHHYAMRKGIAAPYVRKQAALMYPETNNRNGDQLGFGTLLFSREQQAPSLSPSGLTAYLRGDSVVLSWWGVIDAERYQVKRSTAVNGDYVTIAADISDPLTYEDTDIAGASEYFYKVTAVVDGVENAPSQAVGVGIKAKTIFQLDFDEASGRVASNRIANQGNGELVGGASWGSGMSGSAVVLDGAGGYINLPEGLLASLADFTIETRFYADRQSKWARVFDAGSGPRRWMMLTLEGGDGRPEFGISTVHSYDTQRVASNVTMPVGRWVHIAVTLSGKVCTLYLDGVAVGRNDEFTLAPYHLGPENNTYLGRSQYEADPYTAGRYDYFKIWHGALNPDEITALSEGRG